MKKAALLFITIFFICLNSFAQGKTFYLNTSNNNTSYVFYNEDVSFYFEKESLLKEFRKLKNDKSFFNKVFEGQDASVIKTLSFNIDSTIAELNTLQSFNYNGYFVYGLSGAHKLETYIRYLMPVLLENNEVKVLDKKSHEYLDKITKQTERDGNFRYFEYYNGKELIWSTDDRKPEPPVPGN